LPEAPVVAYDGREAPRLAEGIRLDLRLLASA
jgi:hypothetical protein